MMLNFYGTIFSPNVTQYSSNKTKVERYGTLVMLQNAICKETRAGVYKTLRPQ